MHTLTCCRSNWSCIWSCCSCDGVEPWLPAVRLTPDNWESNSAIGSTVSRDEGDKDDNPPEELKIAT